MSALRALLSRRSRRRQRPVRTPLFGAAFMRAVEPPAMSLDAHEFENAETGETGLTTTTPSTTVRT